jgi:purine-binding chemotaxis protein CheW
MRTCTAVDERRDIDQFKRAMQPSPAQFLTFLLGGQRFGVRADDVVEIVRAVRVDRLPKAPPVIEGVIDVRGAVVPVLDIRSRFRLAAKRIAPADHFIIARAKRRLVCIRADRAMDIVTLAENDIADIGGVAPTSEYLAGVGKVADGLVLIHDLATFLSEAEAQDVAAVVEAGQAA